MAKPRKTLWLKVNGEVNTLRRHIINAGYRESYESTIAKKLKCKPSEIPLHVIALYLNGDVEAVDTPEDWHEIIYGRLAKNGKSGSRRKAKGMSLPERVERFLTMPSNRTGNRTFYY